jgi:transposase
MLDTNLIIIEVLPYLSMGKVGKEAEIDLLSIVKAIFYRLKTGCQWRLLPVKQFIDRADTTWNAVYYYYNKWCKDGSWQNVWQHILGKYKTLLDMSCIHLDGSHTRARQGGEAVGYNGRKGYKSTNLLFLVDNRGIIIGCCQPISGEHHDLFEIQEHFDEIVKMTSASDLNLNYLFLNADAGFDDQTFRQYLESLFIEANIDFNKRNGSNTDREEHFDEELYKNRSTCEHPFAWMDAYKGLLVRYEKLSVTWFSMNIMGMIHLLLRKKHIRKNR